MMDKLLPCPFCGGEATIGDGGYSGEQFLVRCRESLCPAASGTVRKTQKQAVAAWNRRTGKDINVATNNAVPVVRGEWIEDGDIQICSNCGEEHSWKEYRASYCEDCGAKMEDKPCG